MTLAHTPAGDLRVDLHPFKESEGLLRLTSTVEGTRLGETLVKIDAEVPPVGQPVRVDVRHYAWHPSPNGLGGSGCSGAPVEDAATLEQATRLVRAVADALAGEPSRCDAVLEVVVTTATPGALRRVLADADARRALGEFTLEVSAEGGILRFAPYAAPETSEAEQAAERAGEVARYLRDFQVGAAVHGRAGFVVTGYTLPRWPVTIPHF